MVPRFFIVKSYSLVNVTSNTINIGDNNYHHIVGVNDGTDLKVYIDGQLDVTNAGNGGNIYNGNRDLIIGKLNSNIRNFDGLMSNMVIWGDSQETEIPNIYNNGTPATSYTNTPVAWWKLNNTTTGIQDSVGSNDGTNNGTTKVNTFVSTEAGVSSGMTEQNLVNNNVSALNGESSGMTSANLVTSTLTRQVPYNSYSLNFDGTSDYIDCGGDTSLQMTGDISVSAWFKTSSTGVQKQIIGRGIDWVMNGWSLFVAGDNKVKIMLNAGGYPVAASSTTVTDGEWHHVVGIRDSSGGAGSLTLYLDGVEGVSADGGSTAMANGSETWIASGTNGGSKMNGKISNVVVWDKALTSTDALKLYNSGVPGDLSNFNPTPVSWWSLGSDSYFNGNDWICPDLVSTNNGTSDGMDANALVGDAPNSTANGTSTNMSIDANLTGNAPNSSNNSFSVNMSYDDKVEDVAPSP